VTLEISLSYESGRWRARGSGLDAAHEELRSLEALVEERLAERGEPAAVMRFDLGSLPRWLSQYQAHYFNYTLRPTPPGKSTLRPPPQGGDPLPRR
jgi:hypothetical protein